MKLPTSQVERTELFRVHVLRYQQHWGEGFDFSRTPWPKTDAEWRQTGHGAPWDSNVHMAQFQLALSQRLADEGLLIL